jgi:hypothetical protein
MAYSFLKLATFITTIYLNIIKKVDGENIKVWSFRTNESISNSPNVTLQYSGPNFDQDLTDFTICFRFHIHVLDQVGDTYKIFRAKSLENEEKISLEVSGKWDSEFQIIDDSGNLQIIFFHADLPIRQWNSMCIMRNMEKEKFKIYQNDQLVYSYNECLTISSPAMATIYPGNVENK